MCAESVVTRTIALAQSASFLETSVRCCWANATTPSICTASYLG
ncbi:anaphase promoting complex protein [Pyrenophora tritici-repentis]|uniref:Uncharacterized protein n=1 Tax=Pyrenophora tritici-repentis TaxID=45151 RepID=A0A5M9KVJ3_9PLEO|nr:anaphase promoting complex subunit protein [Pyrenophora tritici-repentis]KAF7564535.1 hypothetical protein PtrM4_039690 [Pyrenophora tritici-repentis]KAI0585781.1 anaphase promoting complex subunit protein [Pyrenophora tritici-repentis]KAI0589200.1 anaphase promoting complex subunit protein [Pyrenophora tritici-repentis]KAI0614462.1 anaphase promoting complex subunit protein [Pyrenophora tritici-repentis]